jgi:crossover junction endodeoxyribonuclease RuvC
MMTHIIGIDPGLRNTGWGIVISEGSRLLHVDHGIVSSNAADPMAMRLLDIYRGLSTIIDQHTPDEAAIEDTFVNRNALASLKLGHARGAALLALASAGLTCGEYAPNRVKKSVVGNGHADKSQVATMVSLLLSIPQPKSIDAADALAIAITHAHFRNIPAATIS